MVTEGLTTIHYGHAAFLLVNVLEEAIIFFLYLEGKFSSMAKYKSGEGFGLIS
jgi:hypothetical protein